jgi:hypothetical protein
MTELLKACDLYAKTSGGAGRREYLVGYLGGVKMFTFKVHDPQVDGPTRECRWAVSVRSPRQASRYPAGL